MSFEREILFKKKLINQGIPIPSMIKHSTFNKSANEVLL